MFSTRWFRGSSISLVFLSCALAACSDSNSTGPTRSPLSGLTVSAQKDSTGAPPPAPPVNPTPGFFRGTVLGPSLPGAGNDSLTTAPRISGVVITAYPVTSSTTNPPTVGPALASVTTGADGKFQLPTISGGEYVVTFTPPAGSPYGGVWVTATAHNTSGEFPWWVVLWKK